MFSPLFLKPKKELLECFLSKKANIFHEIDGAFSLVVDRKSEMKSRKGG